MGRVKLSNKMTRELLKYALSKGFTWDGKLTGGGHVKLRHPGGGIVILAATPGRGNNGRNSISDIDKAARGGNSNSTV